MTEARLSATDTATRRPMRARPVTGEEARAFTDDGVAVLRGLLDAEEVRRLQDVIEEELTRSWQAAHPDGSAPRRRRFHNDGNLWRRHETLRELCMTSALPEAAAGLLGSAGVRLLMDEVFVKESATAVPVPWHTDISYWPVTGRQALSFWIALDDVEESNGAVVFVRGSHRSTTLHEPTSFLAGTDPGPAAELVADSADRDLVTWTLAPGDAIAFHCYTLHHSPGNRSQTARRRAYSIRYAGDDIRYDPRPGTSPMMRIDGLAEGAPLPGDRYPAVWP